MVVHLVDIKVGRGKVYTKYWDFFFSITRLEEVLIVLEVSFWGEKEKKGTH